MYRLIFWVVESPYVPFAQSILGSLTTETLVSVIYYSNYHYLFFLYYVAVKSADAVIAYNHGYLASTVDIKRLTFMSSGLSLGDMRPFKAYVS